MKKIRFQELDACDLDVVAGGCGGYGNGMGYDRGYAGPDNRLSSYAPQSRVTQGPGYDDFTTGLLVGLLSHLDAESPRTDTETPVRTPSIPSPGTSGGGGIGV